MDFAAVARRFEAKHLQLTLALADETLRFGDECAAAFAGHGAYSNRVTGFGLAPEHVDRAIAFFDARGEDTKLETSSYAPAPVLDAVAARGFQLRFFTHVLALSVRDVARTPPPAGITIERLDRTDASAVRAAAVHNDRCFSPEREPSEIAVGRTMMHLTMPTNDTFVARARGEIVGVGCSESSHGLTILFGGAVRPDHRGRGLQQALMNVRLAAAHERGSDLACVMTGPGTSSERNARRAGFQLAGARAFFARPRP
ncbi:MAG: GNAT family N-acetyltransferase [Labilithrix sp.]|nr:GNAT family N-acetyltransferase [Labilithrix sp.]MCW5811141.1 GNAT family N-acetyltransferase [Labilithrix sp.]